VGVRTDSDLTFGQNGASSKPHLITQTDINYLVLELNLSENQAGILASRLKGWNFCQLDAIAWYYATGRMN
jgi:hypothetical protein